VSSPGAASAGAGAASSSPGAARLGAGASVSPGAAVSPSAGAGAGTGAGAATIGVSTSDGDFAGFSAVFGGSGAGSKRSQAFIVEVAGTVEWCMYASTIAVDGVWSFVPDEDGSTFTLTEREFVSGNSCNGWSTRFGHNHWWVVVKSACHTHCG
jgi:hypothetical protein